MATRVTFLCAGATASSRIGAFPSHDEPLDAGGASKAAAFRRRGPLPDMAFSSPGRAAIDTAAAIGLDVTVEPCLADLDFGDWSGRTFAEIATLQETDLRGWLADPALATPGGETMAELQLRTGAWLDRHAGCGQQLFVVTHASVMRAAIAYALAAPLAATMQIDVAPLSLLELSFTDKWRLRQLKRSD